MLIISLIFLSLNIVYADSVWHDTFDDGELDGWETEILDWDLSDAFTGEAAEFDLTNGTLKAPEGTPGNIWYLATHNSSIDIGTWSFDVNIVDTDWWHFYVFFMTDDWEMYPGKAYSYDLVFSTEPGYPEDDSKGAVVLFKRGGWRSKWDTMDEWGTSEEIVGWHHVDVTRDPDGVFDVYLDDELIIHVEEEEPEFDKFSTFRFEASSGPEIDNVVVLDTYDIETAREYEFEPEPEPEPEPEAKPGGIPGFAYETVALGLASAAVILWTLQQKG